MTKRKPRPPITDEERAARSARSKAKWQDPAYREKIVSAMEAGWQNPVTRARWETAHKKRVFTPEGLAAMSAASHRRWAQPDARANFAAKVRGPRKPKVNPDPTQSLSAKRAQAKANCVPLPARERFECPPEHRHWFAKMRKAGFSADESRKAVEQYMAKESANNRD